MAAKDVRYGRSAKGRARNRRHNQTPFRRLMQCERAAQRRAREGYATHRLVFGMGPQIECPTGYPCHCYSHSLRWGILKPDNPLLTATQRETFRKADALTRELQKVAHDAALDQKTEQTLDALQAMYPHTDIRAMWRRL